MFLIGAELSLDEIDHLADGRTGTFDVACPCCGPYRQRSIGGDDG
jgi:hypothetical protein